jgi:hypothetical protein
MTSRGGCTRLPLSPHVFDAYTVMAKAVPANGTILPI